MLIEHGVAVALATDVNPGGGFSPSMPFAMTLACFGMNMTLEEALVGATINAAASLDRARSRRQPRSRASRWTRSIIDGTLAGLLRVGAPVIAHVVKRGRGRPVDARTEHTCTAARACGLESSDASIRRPDRLSSFSTRSRAPDPTPGGGTASAVAGAHGRPRC